MKINYGQLALERRFKDEKRAAIAKARELGHDPNWVYDDTVEGALWCDDCGLWGRVVISPMSSRERKDDIGGAILENRCEQDAVHKVHGEEARRIVDLGMDSSMPSMFADIGIEPKEVDRENFQSRVLKKWRKNDRIGSFNGRTVGGWE
jgi:hypothetical protein